jgi:hypothetical protein
LSLFLLVSVLCAFLHVSQIVNGQDLIASEDVGGGFGFARFFAGAARG